MPEEDSHLSDRAPCRAHERRRPACIRALHNPFRVDPCRTSATRGGAALAHLSCPGAGALLPLSHERADLRGDPGRGRGLRSRMPDGAYLHPGRGAASRTWSNQQMALKKSELYSSLWQSCDELRGGMDASQYKDYVLVLLFIKYITDFRNTGLPY